MMELDTKALQIKIAEQLHDRGCADKPTTHDPDRPEECLDWQGYVIDAAFLLGNLMPTVIKDIVIPVRKDEDQRIAQRIRAELVCCDITERMNAEAAKGRWDDENHQYLMPQSWYDLKKSHDYHTICYFGGWAANIARAGFQACCDNPEGHIVMGPETDEED